MIERIEKSPRISGEDGFGTGETAVLKARFRIERGRINLWLVHIHMTQKKKPARRERIPPESDKKNPPSKGGALIQPCKKLPPAFPEGVEKLISPPDSAACSRARYGSAPSYGTATVRSGEVINLFTPSLLPRGNKALRRLLEGVSIELRQNQWRRRRRIVYLPRSPLSSICLRAVTVCFLNSMMSNPLR